MGDLDLLVTGQDATPALDRFIAYSRVEEVLGRGENKASAKVGREGLQVDVRALPPASFGAALQYFTGSKDHNVSLRTRAARMGFKLSEYGLFRSENDARVADETEAGIYEALGLPWIPPELRENAGEIEAAEEGRLPQLVELADIRGDLHMHTVETDGRATLEEMAAAAARDPRLPVHRHHRPLQSAGDGQRFGRKTRGRVRAAGAPDQSKRRPAFASSPASNATSCAMVRWIWLTTRWPNWTW